MASIEEILHHFTRLVGCHDIKDKQPIIDDMLASKGQLWEVDIFHLNLKDPKKWLELCCMTLEVHKRRLMKPQRAVLCRECYAL